MHKMWGDDLQVSGMKNWQMKLIYEGNHEEFVYVDIRVDIPCPQKLLIGVEIYDYQTLIYKGLVKEPDRIRGIVQFSNSFIFVMEELFCDEVRIDFIKPNKIRSIDDINDCEKLTGKIRGRIFYTCYDDETMFYRWKDFEILET